MEMLDPRAPSSSFGYPDPALPGSGYHTTHSKLDNGQMRLLATSTLYDYDNTFLEMLKEAIKQGCNDYYQKINNPDGIYDSVNKKLHHGDGGKQRSEKIITILANNDLANQLKCIQYIFYSIIICKSQLLSDLIIKNVLLTGIYAEKLIPLVKKYSDAKYNSNGNDKIKCCLLDMLKMTLGITETNENSINQLSQYLDHEITFDPNGKNSNDYTCLFRWLISPDH